MGYDNGLLTVLHILPVLVQYRCHRSSMGPWTPLVSSGPGNAIKSDVYTTPYDGWLFNREPM